jgi:hypothetical protein
VISNTSRAPWPAQPNPQAAGRPVKTTTKAAARDANGLDGVRLVNLPFPGQNHGHHFKYDAFFDGMEIGQAVECPTKSVNRLVIAMKSWIERRGHKGVVRSRRGPLVSDPGYVWWLPDNHPAIRRPPSKRTTKP